MIQFLEIPEGGLKRTLNCPRSLGRRTSLRVESLKALLRWSRPESVVIFMLLICAGCAHAPLNAPSEYPYQSGGYRLNRETRTYGPDDSLVLMFFSGGGTRAAALSFGVLKEMANTPTFEHGRQRRFIDDLTSISAISGGSFTAAYYCLFGDRIFTSFEREFLKKDIQDALVWECLSPRNWPRLMSPDFGRSDLAAEYYDKVIFKGLRYKDLALDGSRPFLVINGTDLSTEARFSFTQNQFDLLGSDIGDFPVSRAVAASSAVPVLLTPITLKNYAGLPGGKESTWLHGVPVDASSSEQEILLSKTLKSYLDPKSRPYIHVVDGGLSDNLGLRALWDFGVVSGGLNKALKKWGYEHSHRIVLIIVDAATRRDPNWDKSANVPKILSVIGAITESQRDRSNQETLDQFKASMGKWIKEIGQTDSPLKRTNFYLVDVNFENLGDETERRFFEGLPTSFRLPSASVDRLVDAGGRLLRQSQEFQRLLADIQAGR